MHSGFHSHWVTSTPLLLLAEACANDGVECAFGRGALLPPPLSAAFSRPDAAALWRPAAPLPRFDSWYARRAAVAPSRLAAGSHVVPGHLAQRTSYSMPAPAAVRWRRCVSVRGEGSGQTAAHWAAVGGHAECLKLLLAAEPHSLFLRDEREQTPAKLAQREGFSRLQGALRRLETERVVCVRVRCEAAVQGALGSGGTAASADPGRGTRLSQ